MFEEKRKITEIAENILRKRYYKAGETSWEDVSRRVVNWVLGTPYSVMDATKAWKDTHDMIRHRYFIPNSPCLVNAGNPRGGLIACFVVDFNDSIEEIYKTKLEFAQIAKKGGGCGTTLSKLRPEGSQVDGSVHGYAGGPIKFFDTICHDMKAMTQSG